MFNKFKIKYLISLNIYKKYFKLALNQIVYVKHQVSLSQISLQGIHSKEQYLL